MPYWASPKGLKIEYKIMKFQYFLIVSFVYKQRRLVMPLNTTLFQSKEKREEKKIKKCLFMFWALPQDIVFIWILHDSDLNDKTWYLTQEQQGRRWIKSTSKILPFWDFESCDSMNMRLIISWVLFNYWD